jgi:murein DD-endopeptidase MepM/ murein hydrolase activator NlpD
MMRGSLLLALLATACAPGQAAPISYGSGAQPAYAEPSAFSQQAPEPSEEEGRQDAGAPPAPSWADGEGTPLSAYALQPNEAQPFDPAHLPRTHRVRENESLYDVATRYQVPLRALIDQNRLEPPYALRPGSALQLPPPRFHTVARGESFEDVARRYNVDTRSLALLNRMQAPYRVRQGDRIVLPAMARAIEVASGPPAPPPASTVNAGEAPALHSARFAWPLRGQLVTRYGAQPNGVRVDGVEIAGREGAEIAAAADGDVVYAGSDLAAYGTLVLVRHADNYVTAYGHARRALVREGQHVRAGEAIAELGPRSDGRPRLLFQVRRGAEAIDPTPLLGARD